MNDCGTCFSLPQSLSNVLTVLLQLDYKQISASIAFFRKEIIVL